MEKIELKKIYKLFSKEYYYLMKNDNVIGKAWITTKTNFLRRGLYIKIIPSMRNKGYGTKFYKLLINRMSDSVEAFFMWTNEKNKEAINFINKNIDKYDERFYFLNYRGFLHTLIEE